MLFEKFCDAASGYPFERVSRDLVPSLMQAARITTGQRVLDIATGTGIIAEAVAEAVGPSGHVTAADISRPMLEQARKRLEEVPNVSFAVEDGQALNFPDECFDAVVCGMALMLFPDAEVGLKEFLRVMKRGGRAAVSVNTTPSDRF